MRGASVHFKPVKSAAFAVGHSARTVPPTYLLPADMSLGTVCVLDDAGGVATSLEAKMAMASRQALREKNYSPIWEGVINLPDRGDMDAVKYKQTCSRMVEKWCVEYAKLTGHQVLRADVHLDEGHVEDGVARLNAHAHVFIDRTNQLGRVVKVDAPRLRKVQNMTAQVTGLERGKNSLETGRKHLHHTEFKAAAEVAKQPRETAKLYEKLLDASTQQNRDLRAELKRLKDEYAKEREALKASGQAVQQDYQNLKAQHEAALTELDALKRARKPVEPLNTPQPTQPLPEAGKAAQEALRAEWQPIREATKGDREYGRVVAAVDGLAILHIGRGVHAAATLPAGAALPSPGQKLSPELQQGGKGIAG